MEFLEKYLTKEVMDELNVGELKQIIDAWSKATEEASGETLGKSSASPAL